MRIPVAYASKRGSTAEIAEAVAKTFSRGREKPEWLEPPKIVKTDAERI